jgi:hypothetical protein
LIISVSYNFYLLGDRVLFRLFYAVLSRLGADILDGTPDLGALLAETARAERFAVSRVPVHARTANPDRLDRDRFRNWRQDNAHGVLTTNASR